MNVVALRRCRGCGKAAAPVELEVVGYADQPKIVKIVACAACKASTLAVLECVRPVLSAMLKAGIERAVANDVMGYLLDRMHDKAKGA
jgi:hypothetical protein